MNVAINEQEIQAFVESAGSFFETLSPDPLTIHTAYLADADSELPQADFSGCIEISGGYQGRVCFSAPRSMLRKVLTYMHEPSLTDDNFLDAAGEIANILAGNARRRFGETLEISPPQQIVGGLNLRTTGRNRPFVVVVGWERYQAAVVVDVVRVS